MLRSAGPAILFLSLLAFNGCHVGSRAQSFAPAQAPEGVFAEIFITTGGFISGELLEVQDTALLLLSDQQLFLLPYAIVRRAHFAQMKSDTTISDEEAPSTAVREKLRLVSRFPQGVTPELLEQLLAAYGQSEVVRVVRTGVETHDPAVAEFVELARAGTFQYMDRSLAIADGYRLIGTDFPGMGEHWVNPGLIMKGDFDPAHPQVLCYITVNGDATLISVAYAIAVAADERPPESPASPDAWHYHSGSIREESFLLHGRNVDRADHRGPRIVMLHAWVWLENPAGVFAKDNWALPFARLGIMAPKSIPPAAAKALSLTTGGDNFYRALALAVGHPATDDQAKIEAVLQRYRRLVGAWVVETQGNAEPGTTELEKLADVWESMWAEINEIVSPEVRERLRLIRAR